MPPSPSPRDPLIADADRLRHVLVVGKTGAGKSTLLRRLAADDLAAGRGLLLIDPHGDLALQVRSEIPRRRKNDLRFLDGTDPENVPGLNPLRGVEPDERALAASNLLATLKKLFADAWGYRTEHILRQVVLTLMQVRGATLLDAVALLLDESRRRSILRQLEDPRVLAFWTQEFTSYGKAFLAEILAAPLNKLSALFVSTLVVTLLTRRRPRIDARKMLDRGGVLVASLPKGRIGEDAAVLVSGLLLGAFAQAATSRADTDAVERRPFSILVDETATVAPPGFLGFVAEARKFGVGVTLAVQSLSALEASLRSMLLANTGTLACFRVSAEDAELLSDELCRVITPHALQSQDIGEFVLKVGNATPVIVRYDGVQRLCP